MGSINDIYSDFFGSLNEMQKENSKRIDEINQMLHGKDGLLHDGLPGSIPDTGKTPEGWSTDTVMGRPLE